MKTIKIITNDDEEHYFDLCEVKKFELIEIAEMNIGKVEPENVATEPSVDNQDVGEVNIEPAINPDTTYDDIISDLTYKPEPKQEVKRIIPNATETIKVEPNPRMHTVANNDIPSRIRVKEK